MATKKFTFDPESGVAYGANLVINPGADFRQHFEVENLSNGNFDFYTGSAGVGNTWTGTGAMVKSVAIGASYSTAAATFTVGFTSATEGKFIASLTAAQKAKDQSVNMESDLANLKGEMNEIKSLLKELVSKTTT